MSTKREVLTHPNGRTEQTWQGFSWPAFLFTPIWCLIKGLLLHSIISIIGAMTGIGFIFWLVAGFEGNKWHYEQLIKDGFIPENGNNPSHNKKEGIVANSNIDDLEKLGRLKEAGHITDDEFNEQKKKLLLMNTFEEPQVTTNQADAVNSNDINTEAPNQTLTPKKKTHPLVIFAIVIFVVLIFYFIGSSIEFTATIDESETINNTVEISGIASGKSAKVRINGKLINVTNDSYKYIAPVKMGLNEFIVEYESSEKKETRALSVTKISEKEYFSKHPEKQSVTQSEELKSERRIKYTVGGYFAAPTEELLDKVTELSIAKDYGALQQLMDAGLIIQLKSGLKVEVVKFKFSVVKIRVWGTNDEFWTVVEAIKNKS